MNKSPWGNQPKETTPAEWPPANRHGVATAHTDLARELDVPELDTPREIAPADRESAGGDGMLERGHHERIGGTRAASAEYGKWRVGPFHAFMTPQERASAAILRRVEPQPIFMNAFDDVAPPIEVTSHKAIVHADAPDGAQPLGIVGAKYQPVQAKTIIAAHESAIDQAFPADALGNVDVRDSWSDGGAFVKREYVFNSLVCDVAERDRGKYAAKTDLRLRSTIHTTHDGSGCAESAFSSLDGFCTNSLVYDVMAVFRKRHTSGFTFQGEQFAAHASAAIDRWHESVAIMRQWADTTITDQQAVDALAACRGVSERRKEKLLAQYHDEVSRRGNTLWALVSALTYYSSHNDGAFKIKNSANTDNEAKSLTRREGEVLFWVWNKAQPIQRIAAGLPVGDGSPLGDPKAPAPGPSAAMFNRGLAGQ